MFQPEDNFDKETLNKLDELGVKTKIKKTFKSEGYSDFYKRYYLLENHKYLYVLFEMGSIRSIVRQKNARKGFTVGINGQAGQNAEQLYYQ